MSNSPVRILVGMPSGQSIPILTTRSLMQWQHQRKYPSMFEFKIDTYIEKARNELVWNAVNEKATHLMMIDSDMVFPPGGIDKLVDDNKDIVGGLYYGRIHPRAMAFHVNPDGSTRNVDPSKEKGVFEVDFVGTGFLLINMNVFKTLMPPFFKFSYEPEKFGIKATDKVAPALGEDAFFCLNAKQHGFKVWCDSEIELGHVGYHTYYKEDWSVFQDNPKIYERQ